MYRESVGRMEISVSHDMSKKAVLMRDGRMMDDQSDIQTLRWGRKLSRGVQ